MTRSKTKGSHQRDVFFDYKQYDFEYSPENVHILSTDTVYLAYALVSQYALYRNRHVVDTDESVWYGLTDDEWNKVRTTVERAQEELKVAVATTSDIANAIRYLGDQLAAAECCDNGSGTSGQQEVPDSDTDVGGGFPPEFPDQSTYDQYKCDVANYILDKMQDDIVSLQTINWTGIGLAILGAALLTPVPGDEIAVIIAVLDAWILGGSTAQQLLSFVEDIITNDRENYICDLVNSANVVDAKSAFLDRAFDNALTEAGTVGQWPAYMVVKAFATADNFNRLFDEDTSVIYPTGNVCDCDPVDVQFVALANGPELGTGSLDIGTGTRTITSVYDTSTDNFSNRHRIIFSVDGQYPAGDQNNEHMRVRIMASSEPLGNLEWCNMRNFDGTDDASGGGIVIGTWYSVQQLTAANAGSQFTLDIELENPL